MPIVEVETDERTLQETIWFLEEFLHTPFDYKKHRILVEADIEDPPYQLEVVLCKVHPKKNLYGFRAGARPNTSKSMDTWLSLEDTIDTLRYLDDLLSFAFHLEALIENDIYSQHEFDLYMKDRFRDKTKERAAYFSDDDISAEDESYLN